jgi:hypothetical protein
LPRSTLLGRCRRCTAGGYLRRIREPRASGPTPLPTRIPMSDDATHVAWTCIVSLASVVGPAWLDIPRMRARLRLSGSGWRGGPDVPLPPQSRYLMGRGPGASASPAWPTGSHRLPNSIRTRGGRSPGATYVGDQRSPKASAVEPGRTSAMRHSRPNVFGVWNLRREPPENMRPRRRRQREDPRRRCSTMSPSPPQPPIWPTDLQHRLLQVEGGLLLHSMPVASLCVFAPYNGQRYI